MSSDKIDGVPDGWRLVGFRQPKLGEFVIDPDGTPYRIVHDDVTDVLPVIRETEETLRGRVGDLESACRAVLASLEKLATDGDIIWLDPPHVLPGVHESAIERLKSVIEQRKK